MTSLSKFCDDIDTVLLLSCRRLGAVMLSLAMMARWSIGRLVSETFSDAPTRCQGCFRRRGGGGGAPIPLSQG